MSPVADFLDRAAKRAFDVTVGATGLLVLSPMLLAIAVAVRLGSPGPVLYRARRTGRWGHPFVMYKFRTMVKDAEAMGGSSTAENDPRIAPIGRFLRRYKLDEWPQLINVVKGDMSLVGPRPEVEEYTRLYTREEEQILSVRPGMTDLASLDLRSLNAVLAETPHVDRFYKDVVRPRKNRLRLRYARTRTFGQDLRILWLTFDALFARRRPSPSFAALREAARRYVPDEPVRLDLPEDREEGPVRTPKGTP